VDVSPAEIEETEHGLVPKTDGWFVLNATDVRWRQMAGARWANFSGDVRWEQLGFGLDILGPGQPMSSHHWEIDQEDFLVIAGSGTVVIEGEERPLRQWDLVHCPPGTAHTIVGGPMVVVSVGSRERHTNAGDDWGLYVADPLAAKYGASVDEDTPKGEIAYKDWDDPQFTRYDGWLD
jgi:mannose-6-phosphate isomerase-like protein (cupin superfamily)